MELKDVRFVLLPCGWIPCDAVSLTRNTRGDDHPWEWSSEGQHFAASDAAVLALKGER